jgi:perosamine synthetase
MRIIPHNRPSLGDEEINAVANVIKSGWLIAGKETQKLESAFISHTGKRYAVALNSGHAALHLSLLAIGVGAGDGVIVPAYTPGDLLNTIYYTGATPILVDTEKNGFNIDPRKIQAVLNNKTKAIIVPHIFGFPANLSAVSRYKIPIIEDCAQSLGSMYNGKPVGGEGAISIFSFYATKLITTGQGGMVVTNSKQYYEDIQDRILYNGRQIYRVRYNYPMTDIAAAMGNVQYKKLINFIKKRKKIGDRYREVLKNKSLEYWPKSEDTHVNHFRFIIRFSSTAKRNQAQASFLKKGITTIVPYSEGELLHNLLKCNKKDFMEAETMARTTLSLPIFPGLTDKEVERITAAIDEIL